MRSLTALPVGYMWEGNAIQSGGPRDDLITMRYKLVEFPPLSTTCPGTAERGKSGPAQANRVKTTARESPNLFCFTTARFLPRRRDGYVFSRRYGPQRDRPEVMRPAAATSERALARTRRMVSDCFTALTRFSRPICIKRRLPENVVKMLFSVGGDVMVM